MPDSDLQTDDDAEATEIAQLARLMLLRDGLSNSNLASLADAADPAHTPARRRELQAAVRVAYQGARRAGAAWSADLDESRAAAPAADDHGSEAAFDALQAAEMTLASTAQLYVAEGVADGLALRGIGHMRTFVDALLWSRPVPLPAGPAAPVTDEALAARLDEVASTATKLATDPLLAGALSPRQAALMALCAADLERLLQDVQDWAETTARELRGERDQSVA